MARGDVFGRAGGGGPGGKAEASRTLLGPAEGGAGEEARGREKEGAAEACEGWRGGATPRASALPAEGGAGGEEDGAVRMRGVEADLGEGERCGWREEEGAETERKTEIGTGAETRGELTVRAGDERRARAARART